MNRGVKVHSKMRIRSTKYSAQHDTMPSVMHELHKENNEVHTDGTRNKDLFRIDRDQKELNIYLNSYSNISAR